MASFLGLCHFCEYHGPTVVMLTQSLRQDRAEGSCSGDSCPLLTCDEDVLEPNEFTVLDESLYGRRMILRGLREGSGQSGCSGCWSLGPARAAIFSSDTSSSTSYISSQNGLGPVSKQARDAAVKSISCEVSPNKTGSMVFTNNQATTIMSETFFLKDSTARGLQRYFSIILGNKEKGFILRSFTEIQQKVRELIQILCEKCDANFILETKGSNSKEFCEKRFRKKHENNEPARNLSELVTDPSLFLFIHKHFSRLLNLLETGTTEKAVVGQPVKVCPVLEETRILSFLNIINGLEASAGRLLIFSLLAGRTLEIRSSTREVGRRIADALSLILPNNKTRDLTYFANVVLTRTEGNGFNQTLEVNNQGCFSFTSIRCKCGENAGNCPECSNVSNSTAVQRLINIAKCCELNSCTVHTSILAAVEGILAHAKVWKRIGSGADKRTFLRRLGFGFSDAEILNFFQIFIS